MPARWWRHRVGPRPGGGKGPAGDDVHHTAAQIVEIDGRTVGADRVELRQRDRLAQRPVVRMLYPALCALRKSINAQMSPLDIAPPNAGIAGAPDGASMPCEMYQ